MDIVKIMLRLCTLLCACSAWSADTVTEVPETVRPCTMAFYARGNLYVHDEYVWQ